jgi:pSer/pThr/pTyr-binding forkhead associated (FHA) protein
MFTSQPIRNVVLEARSGPSSGFRLWIRPGQRVTVGRTDAADFSLKRDHRISSKHFALECQPTQCLIRDLKSANGTWLNGQRIEHAVLEDGMLITVGATELRVGIETEPAPERTPETAFNAAADVLRTTESEFVGDDVESAQQEQPPVASEPSALEPSMLSAAPSIPVPALQQVCLEAVSGPGQGKKIWLRPPQNLVVGRTDQADFVLRRDHELSGRHFAIECDRQRAWVKDLNSRNGTYLLGARVAQSLLADGDRLRAGRSEFAVSIQGGIAKQEVDQQRAAASKGPRSISPWAKRPAAMAPLPRPCTYVRFACRSGLWLYRGAQAIFQPGLLASRLAQLAALCLVVDPSRWDDPNQLPADLPLLWADNGNAPENAPSPRLLCLAPDDPRLQQTVEQGWSRDALIAVYAKGEVEKLIDELQRFARGLANDPAARHVARLNPGMLADYLANSAPNDVASLLEHAAAIFLEAHQGERWAAFSTREFDVVLQAIGLTPAPAWKS